LFLLYTVRQQTEKVIRRLETITVGRLLIAAVRVRMSPTSTQRSALSCQRSFTDVSAS